MLTVNQNILVDFASKEAVHVTDFKYKQGEIDKSGINIDIASASITENTVLKVNWLYAADYDYVYVQNDGDYISSTKMKIYPPQNTLLPGLVAFEILLVEMSGETPLSQLKGPSVYIPVAEALIDDEEASMEDENIAAIISLINENDRLIGVVEQLDADVRAAEAVRDQNETNRNSTLDAKVSTVNSTVATANTAKTNADNAAANANTKATLANDKATLANTARDAANAAKTAADTAKSAADTATTNANNAATAANNAATAANTAATSANTAATNANNAATAANTAADRATAAITSSSAAVTEISQARVDMSGTTHASIGARMNSDFNTLASAVPKEIAVSGTETVTTNNTLAGDVSGVVATGQTLVNLWQPKTASDFTSLGGTITNGIVTLSNSGAETYRNAFLKNDGRIKPNTAYTVGVEILEVTGTFTSTFNISTNVADGRADSNAIGLSSQDVSIPVKSGFYTAKATSKSDTAIISKPVSLRTTIGIFPTGNVVKFRCFLLEGDHTDKPLEFFEGLKSAEVAEVTSHGVNLVDVPDKINDNFFKTKTGFKINTYYANYTNDIDIIGKLVEHITPNKTYTAMYDTSHSGNSYEGRFVFYEKLGVLEKPFMLAWGQNHVAPQWIKNAEVVYYYGISNVNLEVTNYRVYEVTGSEPSTYVPYSSSKTTLSTPITLRSLPNGVADTYDFDTQTLTRRCGEVVLNGSESWTQNGTQSEDFKQFRLVVSNTNGGWTTSENARCDRFIWDVHGSYNATKECFAVNNSPWIAISIVTSKLTTPDVAGFKAWLAQNPTTVVYQLAEPTTEYIENNGQLRSYDNQTTISVESVVPCDIKSNIPINLKAWLESQNVTMAMLANDASIQAAMMEQIEEEQKVQSAEISSAQLALIDLYEMGL